MELTNNAETTFERARADHARVEAERSRAKAGALMLALRQRLRLETVPSGPEIEIGGLTFVVHGHSTSGTPVLAITHPERSQPIYTLADLGAYLAGGHRAREWEPEPLPDLEAAVRAIVADVLANALP